MKPFATIGMALAFGLGSSAHAATAIYCGKLVQVEPLKLLERQTIMVEGNSITSVEDGYQAAGLEDETIDLKDHTCMPGLMDMHVHLAHEFSPGHYMERFTFTAADFAIRATVNAEKTLMAGFTQVRELGDRTYGESIALRNAERTSSMD